MKNNIVKSILFTISIMSSVTYATSSEYFEPGRTIFLDTKNVPNWADDNHYPYMYLFHNLNGSKEWIKMKKVEGNNNCFKGTVPNTEGGGKQYNGLIFVSSTANLDNINDKWNYRVFQTKDLMYSNFNKITNYYVLYGKFDKYWEVPGKYSYSEFKQASDANNVTVWVNTATLSSYPEHITYKTIDEYQTNAESGKETEIIKIVQSGFKAIELDETSNYATQYIKDETTELTKDLVKSELIEFKRHILASDKLEVIQQLVNECAKQLGYTIGDITLNNDYSTKNTGTFKTQFASGDITYSNPNINITDGNTTFTIDTSQENPQIIKNTIEQIVPKVEENKKNEIKDLVKNLYNVFDFNIIDLYNNILDEQFENIKSINNCVKTTLTCGGTARWNWETCSTTFNITSLKFKASENDADGIEILTTDADAININKPYVEGSTYNDIQESDILVNLLPSSKLFYEYDDKKYVFNKVDFSGMKYYLFASKYTCNNDSKLYNMLYCLKCALNNTENSTCICYCDCENYNINLNNDCENCTVGTNQFDNKKYYTQQINFLNKKANGCQNRLTSTCSDKILQKLCTIDNLIDGWK